MSLTDDERFPLDYDPGGAEIRKTYSRRVQSGFMQKYLGGEVVLDIGFKGASNPGNKTVVPHATGVDTDYPGYDGTTLPFADASVNSVFSSHCLEHMWFPQEAIRDQFRTLKIGGYLVCFVPNKFLYEKRSFPPSQFNADHKRFFTPASLLQLYEESLAPNSYRVRHLMENDLWFDYKLGPDRHSVGCYEIELVIEKIVQPAWEIG